jgi:hypothetical protein
MKEYAKLAPGKRPTRKFETSRQYAIYASKHRTKNPVLFSCNKIRRIQARMNSSQDIEKRTKGPHDKRGKKHRKQKNKD